MPGHAPKLALALAVTAGAPYAPGQRATQDPTASLHCEVTAVRPAVRGSVLLDVEVSNEGQHTAAPAVFVARFRDQGGNQRLERHPLPYAGRRGRGVAAGGSARWLLQARSDSVPKASAVAVEVIAATFHDDPPATASPVEVGPLRQGTVQLDGRTVPTTYVQLRNTATRPVDVVLSGTLAGRSDGRALFTARLQAAHDGEVDFSTVPLQLAWGDMVAGIEGVELTTVDVIDWSTVEPGEIADPAATRPLALAYDRWLRWPEPWPSGDGTFRAVYSRSNHNGGAPTAIAGRFRLKDVAPPLVLLEDRLDLQPMQALDAALDAAFADLRRPSPARFESEHRLSLQDRGRYLAAGPGWPGRFADLVDVRGGRIVGLADSKSPESIHQRWLLQDCGDGYLVVGRDTIQTALGDEPMANERRTYAQVDGWLVPLSYTSETRYGEFVERIELHVEVQSLEQRGAQPAAAPGGPACAALRTAWDSGYRYPDAPARLQAKFEVRTPGSDHIWRGHRRVKGDLVIDAFPGFRSDGRGLWPRTISIDDAGLSTELRDALAAATGDRLLLWATRDFAGREPFDRAFRGAVVLADDDRAGVFEIGGGALREVEVRDGRVVRLLWTSGMEREITWKRLGDVQVPVGIRTGDEVLTASWKRIGGDWYLPIDLRIERAFGADWGPETLKLSRVKVD